MPLTERLQILVEAVGAGGVARDFDRVGKAAGGLATQAKAGKFSLDGLAASAGVSSGVMKAGLVAGATAAGSAIVAFGAKSVDAFYDLGQEVLKFQRASGTTAEEASALVAAADDVGVSADVAAKGVFQLGKRLETSAADLAKYGITARVGADGNTDMAATLLNVADAYVATEDPAQRAALVNAAFGRSGADLIPLLERGAAGIKALYEGAAETGQILSQDEVNKAENFRIAMDNLHDSVGELSLRVGEALVPNLIKLANASVWVIDKLEDLGESGHGLWEGLADRLGPLGDALEKIGVGNPMPWLSVVGADGERAGAGMDTFAGGLADVDRGISGLVPDMDTLRNTMLASTSAQRSYNQALSGSRAAAEQLTRAQDDLNVLLAQGAVDAKAVASAQREVASAARAAERAQEGVADATGKVNRLNKELADLLSGKTGAEKAADAEDDLVDARSDHQHAIFAEARAAERLGELQRSGTASGLDIMEATQDLADARRDETRAAQGVRDAEADLLAAQKIGAENSPEVIAVRSDLKDANKELGWATEDAATATTNLAGAQTALNTAQKGDTVQYNKDVAAAKLEVKNAEDGLTTSKYNVAQQAWGLYAAQKAENEQLSIGWGNAIGLREEFERLVALKPELMPFLGPLLERLAVPGGIPGGVTFGTNVSRATPGVRAPSAQHGGIFTPSEGLALLHGPEAIIPLRGGGVGGQTININNYVNGFLGPGAETELARAVHSALLQMQRRNGNLGIDAA